MDKPAFFYTPGYGETMRDERHYAQALKIDNRIETSGQGGWSDEFTFPDRLEDEIAQAFVNVERTLAAAGASWKDVVHVNSYHVGFPPETNETMIRLFRQYMPERHPLWTETGVTMLGEPHMRVEIRVTAIVA